MIVRLTIRKDDSTETAELTEQGEDYAVLAGTLKDAVPDGWRRLFYKIDAEPEVFA